MKIKIKKEIKWTLLGIIVLIIIVVLVMMNNYNKNLSGKKITSGLYEYNFEEKQNIQNISIENNKIYYLINNGNTYSLKEINVYTNKTKEVGSINSDVCFFNNNYLLCSKGEVTTVYDFNLKEIYKSDKYFSFIPYQDSFLIVDDKDIYLNNKKIRTIKEDIKRFDVINYCVIGNNTFIEFVSINDLYIYNVKEDSYEKIDFNSVYGYNKGFYYGTKDKIVIKNLENMETKEYNNFTKSDAFSLSTIKDNLFFYVENGYLKIYNLDTDKFRFLDYKFDNIMSQIIVNDNYLYLIYEGENPQFYVINLEELNSNEYTEDEYKEMQMNKISTKVQKLKNKYKDVTIVYNVQDMDSYEKWHDELVNEDDLEIIDDELDAIDNILKKFGNEFLSTFKHDNYKGLRIILVKEIKTSKNAAVQDLAGQFFLTNSNYNIILVSKKSMSYEQTLCHEMMHAIDDNAANHKYDIAGSWYDYNPKGFEYSINYFKNNNLEYTIDAYDGENAYFVDTYNKVNQYEDRARIFENICYVENDNIIKKHPNLLKKAEYIRDELLKYYPSINNSSVFASIE